MMTVSSYRLDGSWSCARDHRTTPCGDCDGCRSVQQENRTLLTEIERLRQVERFAREVMAALEEYGEGIVGHLLDNDDNSGEYLRRALGMATCTYYQGCGEPRKPCGYCSTHCLCGPA